MMKMNYFARKSVYILAFVLVLMMGVSMLSGCTGGSADDAGKDGKKSENTEPAGGSEADEKSADETAAGIFGQLEFEDEMTKVSEDLFFGLFNLDSDKVKDVAAYESTGATAEEIVVVTAAEGCEEDVRAALSERVESQKESFRDYVPQELDKLSDAVIYTNGRLAVLIVCNDSSKANKILEEI